jgi:hypothetical protein
VKCVKSGGVDTTPPDIYVKLIDFMYFYNCNVLIIPIPRLARWTSVPLFLKKIPENGNPLPKRVGV